ncbi:MAG: transketolase, partial [Coriobacteriia bacterium]
GQGLSAGVGLALGARLTGASWHTFVVMSDGEQHKGQVAEARRLAAKENLDNLTAVIDCNGIQISGHTSKIMPVDIAADWAADGWRVLECDGHDLSALHEAVRDAVQGDGPAVVVAHTVIGKGVSFMEDLPEFHGRALTAQEYTRAAVELGVDSSALERARGLRTSPCAVVPIDFQTPQLVLAQGDPRTYSAEKLTDNRSAWGTALTGLADANPKLPIAVLDCDLAVSVKTDGFAALRPQGFVQCGVGEHNAATVGGALSTVPGVLTFWSDFGVFGIDEAYNQQRLNDINGAALKLVVTHCGLDVGEDGKTHQCLDYVGAFRELFGWKVVVPADPNQTDRAVRVAAAMQGNICVAVGRSKLPVLLRDDGTPLFADDYEFAYGEVVWAREGEDAVVLAMGTLSGAAVAASDALAQRGISAEVGIVACPLHLDDSAMAYAAEAPLIVTVEDHNARTGLGASVAEWLADHGCPTRLVRLGVEGYQASGTARDLYARAGLDSEGIASSIERALR